jgi:ribosomal protein S12 methylthiotransferase accessory factor
MKIEFPGGVRVDAIQDGYRIRTDQPAAYGGADTAPSPFELFLGSIGTCAGFYALRFLQQRRLETEGLSLTLTPEWDEARKLVTRISLDVRLPESFPEKYHDALIRAIGQCSVKRHLEAPPEIEVVATRPELAFA